MSSFYQWLTLHGLSSGTVQDILSAYVSGELADKPSFVTTRAPAGDGPAFNMDRDTCLAELVIPALASGLGDAADIADLLGKVAFSDPGPEDALIPRTEDRGGQTPPRIVMGWAGQADDVICLAHEAGHALQIMLSDGATMPPLAREVCAFLGEVMLLEFTSRAAPEAFAALHPVWTRENAAYLGDDLTGLANALGDPQTPYDYRQNYPVARLAALYMFRNRTRSGPRALFSAGADGMQQLPIAAMANLAGAVPNVMPPMPDPDTDRPAINAYRSLGAMVLLDIQSAAGAAEQRIEAYYDTLLQHLQTQTAFVALNPNHKPVGYATWRDDGSVITLSRQTAPFGDYLTLQRALARRIKPSGPVLAQHPRSARQEQVAW